MSNEKIYRVNELFYSLQGEGMRAGTTNLFVRFADCNLACGFCDTEFASFTEMTAEEVYKLSCEIVEPYIGTQRTGVIFTGGEPLLQLDDELLSYYTKDRWLTACETNGTMPIPELIEWSTCSPKVAEHAVVPKHVSELKYVRSYGQGIPRPSCEADHYLVSPIFSGNQLDVKNLEWCIDLVKKNPSWRLTIQMHKLWKIR